MRYARPLLEGVDQMKTINIKLRLDTPLLLGGSVAGELESTSALRPASLRGLFRTFARAYLGYMLGGITDKHVRRGAIHAFENALLGSAAETNAPGNTYHLALERSNSILTSSPKYPLVPKSTGEYAKGSSPGFDTDQQQQIDITLPRRSLNRNPHFADALLSVAWIAVTLGSLGKRSRRGYGSLSITDIETRGSGEDSAQLPSFADVRDREDLAKRILSGINRAKSTVHAWRTEEIGANDELIEILSGAAPPRNDKRQRDKLVATARSVLPDAPKRTYEPKFFQFAGLEHVYVGNEPENDSALGWKTLLARFNESCHQQLSKSGKVYAEHIGSADPRFASPVWLRIYQTEAGFLPVITVSPPDPAAASIVAELAKSVSATPINKSKTQSNS
jgi:hypothetical protein